MATPNITTCEFMGRNASMKITSVTGHMMGLEFDARYKSWQGVDPEQLFTAEIKKTIPQDKQGIKRTLEEEGRRCSVLLLWLDCDLEGENIAYEVIDIATTYNKRMDIYRAKFSALIPRDIFRTMQHPERPNKHMSDAVDARQEIDLRLGAAFTRFQTLRLQGKFDALKDNVISYGPCQFPTLGFVVERHLKILSFVAEDFWSIGCELETPDQDERGGVLRTSFHWERGRLYDRLACLILFEMCVDIGTAVVTESQARPTTRARLCPLNTIELQKRASRFLRMSSDTTMKVAEALYQRGILSYPRTETDYFKEGFELLPLLEEHRGHADWGDFARRLLDGGLFQWPSQGGHDDQAHPPIHPTKSVSLDSLTDPQERQLYELVTRHFLACCAPDATGQLTTLRVQMSRPACEVIEGHAEQKVVGDAARPQIGDEEVAWLMDGEVFKATGLMVQERNWLDVYAKWEKWSGNKVASLLVGEVFRPQNMQMTASHTQPPQALTESDLISEMDRNGIGTDATIAQHITTIQDRTYAFKDDQGRFVPSELGIGLVEGYNVMGYQLNKPSLRAAMEKDCQAVARGQMQKEVMVRNCLTQMRECFRNCVQEARMLDEALGKYFQGVGGGAANQHQLLARNVSACGVCHNGMDLKVHLSDNTAARNNPRRFLFCGSCQTAHSMPKKGELSQCEDLCPICSFQILTVTNPDTAKSHTICPKCFGDPPSEYSDPGVSGEFRCFACSHPTCSHAGHSSSHKLSFCQCYHPRCSGMLTVRKVEGSGFVAGCSSYPECKASWWLPKSIRSVEPSPTLVCARCSQAPGSKGAVHKLLVTTIRSLVPPCVPPEDAACPCCSSLWDDLGHTRLQLPKTAGDHGANRGHVGASGGTAAGASNYQNSRLSRPAPAAPASRGGSGVSHEPSNSSDVLAPSNFLAAAAGTAGPSKAPQRGANSGAFPSSRGKASSTSDYRAVTAGGSGGGNTGPHSSTYTTHSLPQRPQQPQQPHQHLHQSKPAPQHQLLSSDQPPPLCECRMSSVRLTVSKEGPTCGKGFFKCAKPQGMQCKFFEWDVVGDTSSGGGRGSRPVARAVGRVHSKAGDQGQGWETRTSDVVCSRCKQVGHYAKLCPNKSK